MKAEKVYRIVTEDDYEDYRKDGDYGIEILEIYIQNDLIIDSCFLDVMFFKKEKERDDFLKANNYLNIESYKIPKIYKIVSVKQEEKEFNSLEDAKQYILNHIRKTKQEYADNNEQTQFEVDSYITFYRESFDENLEFLNKTLMDYGFKEIIVE